MSFWEDWFRRRRPWRAFDVFEEIDRMLEDMMKSIYEEMPKSIIQKKRLPDGSTVKIFGPFVYGYSMGLDPGGKPVIRGFGNVKQRLGAPKLTEQREPLVDVVVGDRVVQVVAEVPGVEKSDIDLYATEDRLTISVDSEKRKYFKDLELPEKVDPKSAKASYKNGILEVLLNKVKVGRKPEKKISIE